MECENVEPFRYPSVSQGDMEQGVSGSNINEQAIEQWLARLLEAVCNDLQDLEQRVIALETP